MKRLAFVLTLCWPALGAVAAASPLVPEVFDGEGMVASPTDDRAVGALVADCSDGIVYDDGNAESAFRLVTGGGGSAEADVVMLFDLGSAGGAVEQVCVCWNTTNGGAANFDHQLIFYAADGPMGSPGTQVAVIDVMANGVPPFLETRWFNYDISGLGIESPTAELYAGVRWIGGDQAGPGHILCTDENGPGMQPMFAANAGLNNWTSLQVLFSGGTPPAAVMVRLNGAAAEPGVSIPAASAVSLALLAALLILLALRRLRGRDPLPGQ